MRCFAVVLAVFELTNGLSTAPAPPKFHVHFGAGKLGLGLVVPAIAATGDPFAVVARPSSAWDGVAASGEGVALRVNGEAVATVPLVVEADPAALSRVASRATSFSTALGPGLASAAAVLETLPASAAPPKVFCCENDHDAVAALKVRLRGRADVVDCVVDRVCTARDASAGAVDVAAEPWPGSIVVLEPGLRSSPFANATLPKTAAEAAFHAKRKASLVNGMHTVLSFLTLNERGPRGGATLLKYTEMHRSDQRLVEAWRTVRVAELLEEFGAARVAAWLGARSERDAWRALLDFADEVLVARFSRVDDRVRRVLGGGVEDRFETRLEPVSDWVLKHGLSQSRFFLFAAKRDRDRARERGRHPAFRFAKSDRLEPPRTSARAALRRARLACVALLEVSRPFLAREGEILRGARANRKLGRWENAHEGVEPAYGR